MQAKNKLRPTWRPSAGSPQRENRQTGLAPVGNAPLFSPAAVLPPKGETTHYILCVALLLQNVFAVHPGGGSLLSAYPCANLSRSLHSAAKICPSGEEAAAGGRRGAFPRAKVAVVWFSLARRAVVWFYKKRAPQSFEGAPPSAARRYIKFIAQRAIPQPSRHRRVKL